jgi:hypothetical protein
MQNRLRRFLKGCLSDPSNAAITWPQDVIGEESNLAVAAQVDGEVREWQECPVPEAVTSSQSPSPSHLRKSAR